MKRTVALVLVTGLALTLAACHTTTSSPGPGGPTVRSLDAGSDTSYALETDGTVWDWGYNGDGELGDDCTIGSSCATSSTPVQVVSRSGSGHLGNVTAIAAGGSHALALRSNGTVVAWGYNADGQLGNGATGTGSSTPVQATGLGNVVAIAAGGYFSLALDRNGHVWAWGHNTDGQLGNGCTIGTTCTDSSTPVEVVGSAGTGALSNVTAIAAGFSHALALTTGGTVYAWGSNRAGELGNNTTSSGSSVPVQVLDSSGGGPLSNIEAISAGERFSLALNASGHVMAWGYSGDGELGNGTTSGYSSTPVAVQNASGSRALSDIEAIAAGSSFALALKHDGTVRAWGFNADGELGNDCASSCTDSGTPVTVTGSGGSGRISNVTDLGAGYSDGLALRSNGTVWAWGDNASGELGISASTSTSSIPVKVHF